jgi:hypothetical protein
MGCTGCDLKFSVKDKNIKFTYIFHFDGKKGENHNGRSTILHLVIKEICANVSQLQNFKIL